MGRLKEGTRVMYPTVEEKLYGRIEQIIPDFVRGRDILLVRLDNKNLVKCREEDIIIGVDEAVEPDTITITREDFLKAVSAVVDPSKYDASPSTALMVSMSGMVVCSRLETELFDSKNYG